MEVKMKQNDKQGLLSEVLPFLYWFLSYLASSLPHKVAFRIANQIGRLKYMRNRSRLLLHDGMTHISSPEQVESSLLRAFQLDATSDLELWFFPQLDKENIARFVEVQGLENLNQALQHGKGVILYSAHLYSLITAISALGVMGYKPNVVGHPDGRQPSWVERWCRYKRPFTIMERRLGCRFMFMGANLSVGVQAFRALKRNEVVIVTIDKPTVQDTIEVDFLNNRASFPIGPFMLAQSTGSPLLDFHVHRPDELGPALCKIGVPFHPSADLNACAQHCASRLEESILRHPVQWTQFWRFKDYSSPLTYQDRRPEKRI
jgi:KDO2-lipid IV(A) lauroyltransferase